MRAVVVMMVLLLGCNSGGSGFGCPSSDDHDFEGTACDVNPATECFVVDQFSSCRSAFYRCESGSWHQTRSLQVTDGASCADSPIDSCDIEGNDCSAEPTSQSCACGADGAWHCECFCYGEGDCPSCPAEFFPSLDGIECGPTGNTCDFDTGESCECVDDGFTPPHFHCST